MKYIVSIAAVVALAFAGCSADGSDTSQAEAKPEVDQNEKIAEHYAETASNDLASICAQIAKGFPESQALEQGGRILGPQIIEQGGDVDAVMGYLLDRC